ncbi:hypothetical protein JCGZ_23911 [Jatropha curcas]|uniref:Uncharacterized protein n=1 Tax=Jatropha curcas TaxID=180498 RepID=A0A067LFS8_JATCU|nr:uncharacterized protein LOC105629383 [Jatropha curcas]KDP42969.1 hypothetical protein JCGZ_23911 [Jatropha curcas]
MRRQGQYADPGANAYTGAQMQHISAQRMENSSDSDHFQGRLEAFTPERDPYATSKAEGQWRWERDESKVSNPMASRILHEGQGVDASRSYFQGKGPGPEPKLALEKQGINDPRFGQHNEDMQIGYEEKPSLQTFEGLEQKFLDDILKLAKDQNDAEDAENARHREKINAINNQYQEQLVALRARHASRRDEFLRKESNARQHQYQQAVVDRYCSSGMGPGDPHGYNAPSAGNNETHRAYNTDNFESYRERARFLGGPRDQGVENRGSFHSGRVYDTGTRYY